MPLKTSNKAARGPAGPRKIIQALEAQEEEEGILCHLHYKILKQVYPGTDISNKAMPIMNSFVNDTSSALPPRPTVWRTAARVLRLPVARLTAVRLLLHGGLAKLALSEGTKAVTKCAGGR